MEQVLAMWTAFVTAHPFLAPVLAAGAGFFFKSFIITKENAKKAVRWFYARQRAALKKAGKTDAEIQAVMKEEADFLTAAAQEAEDEAAAPPSPADPPKP